MNKLRRLITTLSLTLSLALAASSGAGTLYSTFGDNWSGAPSVGFSINDPGLPSLLSMKKAWSFVAPQTANVDAVEVVLVRHPLFPGNVVTVALHADDDGKPGSLLREATLTEATPFAGQQLRAEFPSVVAVSSGQTYWVVLSAPTSGENRTIATWLPNGGDKVGTGLTECHAGNHRSLRQQPVFVQAGEAGCYLGIGKWHPMAPWPCRNASIARHIW